MFLDGGSEDPTTNGTREDGGGGNLIRLLTPSTLGRSLRGMKAELDRTFITLKRSVSKDGTGGAGSGGAGEGHDYDGIGKLRRQSVGTGRVRRRGAPNSKRGVT